MFVVLREVGSKWSMDGWAKSKPDRVAGFSTVDRDSVLERMDLPGGETQWICAHIFGHGHPLE